MEINSIFNLKMKLEEHIKNSKSLYPLVRMIKNHDDLYKELVTHRYYPDIFIKSINTIIEVKSDYTINENVEINHFKKESCLLNNLNFDYFVVCKKDYRKWKNKKL